MATQVKVVINDKDKPGNIPDYKTLIKQCLEQGPLQETAVNIRGVRLALDKKSDHDVGNIWVKYGGNITMGEAKTQHLVAEYLRDCNNPVVRAPRVFLAFTCGHCGFIVSEYIEGRMCEYADAPRVAAAVQALIAIPSPSATPGPVGGGLIEHPFFYYGESDIWYESVEELQDHVNGVSSYSFAPRRLS